MSPEGDFGVRSIRGDMPQDAQDAIGNHLAAIVAYLMTYDLNFREGRPAIFQVPTDVRDVEIRAVLSLGRVGGKQSRIARIR